MTAKRSGVAQPAPRLLQPPSPTAGSHGTPFNAGQRFTVADVAVEVSVSGTRRPRCALSSPTAASISESQSHECTFSKPVPEAMETLTPVWPVSRSSTSSPNEIQRWTRLNRSGCVWRSQLSLAGQ